jgi:hypothetical protein
MGRVFILPILVSVMINTTSIDFEFDCQQSNLLALAVDFFICNAGDLTTQQESVLMDMLINFDEVLDNIEPQDADIAQEKIQKVEGQLIYVDFGKKTN